MSLFNILIDVAMRTAAFESGFQRVEKRLETFAATTQKLASRASGLLGVAVGFETLRTSIVQKIARGDELDRLAERMHTTTENLSQLEFIARKSDIEFGALAGSIDTFTKNAGMAAVNTGRAQKALKDLGIDANELIKLPLDKQLEVVADRLAAVENPTRKATLSMQLFGSSETLSALKDGSEGLRRLREESDRVGNTLDSLSAKKLAAADDAIKNLNISMGALGSTLAVGVAPFLTTVVNGMNALAQGGAELNLSTQLTHLAEERQRLAKNLSFRQSEFGRLTLGRRADAAIESTKRELAAVESRMNAVNEQMLALQRQSTAVDPLGGAGSGENPVFARQINYYNSLFQELEANYKYLEGLERRRNEQIEALVENRADLERTLEQGIKGGVAETAKEAADEVQALNNVMLYGMEQAMKKAQENAVFAEEFSRSLFQSTSGLFQSLGDSTKDFGNTVISTFKRILADSATRGLFKAFAELGANMSSQSGGSNVGSFLSAIFGAYGGGMAKGGPLEQGKWYVAGEHGPEPIWGGGAGAYATGYGNGGGGSVTVNNYNTWHEVRDVSDAKLAVFGDQVSEATIGKIRRMKRNGEMS